MIKGIIFDADGTLLDSMPVWNQLGERYLKSLNILPENDLGEMIFSMTLEESSAYLKDKYLISESTEEIKTGILNIIVDFYKNEVPLKPGVNELLISLQRKRIPMAIATSGDKTLLIHALKRLGVLDFFEAIYTCSELETSKQKPDIYFAAAEAIGTKAGETAVFEDALFALKTAKSAGFVTVGVEDEASVNEKNEIKKIADFYISGFFGFDFEKTDGKGGEMQ